MTSETGRRLQRPPMRLWLFAIASLALAGCAGQPPGLGAPKLAVPAPADHVISGVTVFNPGAGCAEDQTIVIRDGLIAEVRSRRAGDPEPECPGCIAMPGLIDAHVHNPPKLAFGNQEFFALLYLAHGVTTVRDLGAPDDSIGKLAERLNSGALVGPRFQWCGRVLESAPLSFGAALSVETAEEAAAAVNAAAASGVDCIKIYNNLKPEPYAAIRAAAARHGLPVIGHVPHQVGLAQMRDFEAQHFTGVPYAKGRETPEHSDFRDADWLAMPESDIDAALDLAKQNNVSFLPTLANARLRLIASDSGRYPPTPAAAYLPKLWTKAWRSQSRIASHPTGDAIERRLERNRLFLTVVKRAEARGIDILAGTDTMMPYVVPGESLLLEIDDLAAAFGDAEAALAAATSVNGRHLDPGKIGVIAPGAHADILLLPDDPAADLGALRRWRAVYVGGRLYLRETVDTWLARYKRHFHTPFYSLVMGIASDFVAADTARDPH